MKEEIIIVCVTAEKEHTPESVLMACFECKKDVWVSPWHIGKKLVCINCADFNSPVHITLQDRARASSYIKEKNGM